MIDLLIFHAHIVAALYAFTKSWQRGGLKEGLLSIGIILLAFTILWALTGSLAYKIFPEAWNSIWFTRDTFGLVLLAIPEAIFFYFFFIKDKSPQAKGAY